MLLQVSSAKCPLSAHLFSANQFLMSSCSTTTSSPGSAVMVKFETPGSLYISSFRFSFTKRYGNRMFVEMSFSATGLEPSSP